MLTTATLGMFLYGLYAAGSGVIDLLGGFAFEVWADLGLLLFGVLLMMAAPLVRVLMPGGLALAIGALLGLQALAIHHDAHVYGRMIPLLQATRALFAIGLVLLAHFGARRPPRRES